MVSHKHMAHKQIHRPAATVHMINYVSIVLWMQDGWLFTVTEESEGVPALVVPSHSFEFVEATTSITLHTVIGHYKIECTTYSQSPILDLCKYLYQGRTLVVSWLPGNPSQHPKGGGAH